jgi:hypothetical protein
MEWKVSFTPNDLLDMTVVNVGRLGAQSKRRETELYREREHQLQGFDGFEGLV